MCGLQMQTEMSHGRSPHDRTSTQPEILGGLSKTYQHPGLKFPNFLQFHTPQIYLSTMLVIIQASTWMRVLSSHQGLHMTTQAYQNSWKSWWLPMRPLKVRSDPRNPVAHGLPGPASLLTPATEVKLTECVDLKTELSEASDITAMSGI